MDRIERVPGSLRRVSQLTGEWDRGSQGSKPARNRDECGRVGLAGTDLGAAVTDGDRIWFLFGDTWPSRHDGDRSLSDSVAWTADLSPGGLGPALQFAERNGQWMPPRFPGHDNLAEFEVPTGGFATDRGVYVFFTTDHWYEADRAVMGRSHLLCADRQPGTRDLRWDALRVVYHEPVSTVVPGDLGGHFINVAPAIAPRGVPGLPFDGPAVLMWGSGRYRESNVYLAVMPVASIEDHGSWRYWTAVPGRSWTSDEHSASELLVDHRVGELSVAWVAPLGRWLMTYTNEGSLAIRYCTAETPWGPWSEPQNLYEAYEPLGFGELMHVGWRGGDIDGTDLLYDRGRGEAGGAPYGGYLIDRYTRPAGPRTAEIFFALSTWNPYQVTLMSVKLRVARSLSDQVSDQLHGLPAELRTTVTDVAGEAHRLVGALSEAANAAVRVIAGLRDRAPDRIDPSTVDRSGRRAALTGAVGSPAFIQSTFGAKQNNFEIVAPRSEGGFQFRAADNAGPGPTWGGVATINGGPDVGPIPYDGLTMTLTLDPDVGDATPDLRQRDRLYVVGVTGGRAVYLWRDRQPPWPWRGPFPVIAVELDDRRVPLVGVRGNPAMIRSTNGADHRNFELLVPDATAGVRHFWRDSDLSFPLNPDWRTAETFATELGRIDAVTLIQSGFKDGPGSEGHLEVVVRKADRLFFYFRNDRGWSGAGAIVSDGREITGVTGVPSLVQGGHGAKTRNFELLTPLASGGLAAYWLDNDPESAGDRRWHGPGDTIIDPGTQYVAVAMLQGPFGPKPGNLEVAATRADGSVMHVWRDAGTLVWSNPALLVQA